jgi:hypothetical protein
MTGWVRYIIAIFRTLTHRVRITMSSTTGKTSKVISTASKRSFHYQIVPSPAADRSVLWRTGLARINMRIFWLVVVLLLAETATYGQSVSMTVTGTAEHPKIEVSNSAAIPIEALLVTVDPSRSGGHANRIYYDSRINFRHQFPIQAGQSGELPLPHPVGGPTPTAELRAAVFADGTTFGDEEWVKELLRRRQIMADRLQEVVTLLQRISDQHLSKEQAVADLQQALDARRQMSVNETPEEQGLEGVALYGAIRSFDVPVLPEGKTYNVQRKITAIIDNYNDWLAHVESGKPALAKPDSESSNL